MKFSFLGYSVEGMMEFNLDVKDIVILRYFDDFRNTGKMNYEEVQGEKYYWISYQNIERELPFLGLNRRSIMKRMHNLRDVGVLKHYTKKEGGTFSYYAVDKNYEKLVYSRKGNCNLTDDIEDDFNYSDEKEQSNINKEVKGDFISNNEENLMEERSNLNNNYKNNIKDELAIGIDSESEILDREDEVMNRGVTIKEEPLSQNKEEGCLQKGRTKINLLNNSSTKDTNLLKDISREAINYLNLRAGVIYRANNSKTLSLIKKRLSEGFNLEDFKTVIDKKIEEWKETSLERHLTPFTLFGDKFEMYLNQKIIRDKFKKNEVFDREPRKLRFDNFEPRKYDYDDLEKKLLGWV